MNDMIPVEAMVGVDDDGDYWVRLVNLDNQDDVMDRGPFESQAAAEMWIIVYMEMWGGVCMGRTDGTIH